MLHASLSHARQLGAMATCKSLRMCERLGMQPLCMRHAKEVERVRGTMWAESTAELWSYFKIPLSLTHSPFSISVYRVCETATGLLDESDP